MARFTRSHPQPTIIVARPVAEAGGAVALSGSATIAFANTGALGVALSLAAANAVTFSNPATLTQTRPLSGSNAVAFTNAGTLGLARPLSAANTLTFANVGTVNVALGLSASNAVTFANAGNLTIDSGVSLSAVNTVNFASSGALSLALSLAASNVVAFVSSAALTVTGGEEATTSDGGAYRRMVREANRYDRRKKAARERLEDTIARVLARMDGEPEAEAAVEAAQAVVARAPVATRPEARQNVAELADIRAAIGRLEAALREIEEDEEAAEMLLLAS